MRRTQTTGEDSDLPRILPPVRPRDEPAEPKCLCRSSRQIPFINARGKVWFTLHSGTSSSFTGETSLTQQTLAGYAKYSNADDAACAVPGGNGPRRAGARAGGGRRASRPEGQPRGRPAADAAGADAVDFLSAAAVQPVAPCGRGGAVRLRGRCASTSVSISGAKQRRMRRRCEGRATF